MNEIFYKVLWVDDEENIVRDTQAIAEIYSLDLEHYTNWEDAKEALCKNFNGYSAIIFDAYCKDNINSKTPREDFLISAINELSGIVGENQQYIPWYIFSGGTMNNFGFVTEAIQKKRISDWGKMLYCKDAPDNEVDGKITMFTTIADVAKSQINNQILFQHKDVFKYIGSNCIINNLNGRVLLQKMLSALYDPTHNLHFAYSGNPIRKIIEYLFCAAHHYGLVADQCFTDKGKISPTLSSIFMSGQDLRYDSNKRKVRWGHSGEYIFPKQIANMVRCLVEYANDESHATSPNEPYIIDEKDKEEFYGYLMLLCYLIQWLGSYIENHSNVEINKAKHIITEI